MKTKLIKLPGATIVMSDEKIEFGMKIYNKSFNTIILADYEIIVDCEDIKGNKCYKIIAGLPTLPTIKYNLSDEDAKNIGWVNVEKLAKNIFKKVYNSEFIEIPRHYELISPIIKTITYQNELNDKKFSEEDIRKALDYGANRATTLNKITEHDKNNFIEFISQPQIFDCEIEQISDIPSTEVMGEFESRPKIVNNCVTVTKIL